MGSRARQIEAEVVEASAASAEEEKRRSFQKIFAEYACLTAPHSTYSELKAPVTVAPQAADERAMREPGQRSIAAPAASNLYREDSAWKDGSSRLDATSDSTRSRMLGESSTGTPPHRIHSVNTSTQTPAERTTQTDDHKTILD
eukprot:1205515-Rhodomonas_salina.1